MCTYSYICIYVYLYIHILHPCAPSLICPCHNAVCESTRRFLLLFFLLQYKRHTDTQTHRHTNTQTHKHTVTQTHRHTDTQTHTSTPTHSLTHTHMYVFYMYHVETAAAKANSGYLIHSRSLSANALHRLREDLQDKASYATHCNTLQHTATHCNTLQHYSIRHPTDLCHPVSES